METTQVAGLLASYADVIVVHADRVEQEARRGYRLLHVIENGQFIEERNHGRYDATTGRSISSDLHVITQPLFVMGKLRDELVEELRTKIGALEAAVSERREKVDFYAKLSVKLDEEKKTLERELARHVQENEVARALHRTMQDRVHKMEEDLARVRKHVGSKLFDEAVSMTKDAG